MIRSRYFGRGRSPCGNGDTVAPYFWCIEILQRLSSGARIAQWVGPRTQNLEVPGSIPGSDGSLFGHFLVMVGSLCFSHFLGHVGRCLGILWGCFRMGLWWFREKVPKRSKKQNFKCVREYFSSIGPLKTIIFSRSPDKNIKKNEIWFYHIFCIFFYIQTPDQPP